MVTDFQVLYRVYLTKTYLSLIWTSTGFLMKHPFILVDRLARYSALLEIDRDVDKNLD
jgi:hypothetical protein